MQLVWADEFNYRGMPDPNKWGFDVGQIRDQDAYYTWKRRQNVLVQDGVLRLWAVKEPFEGADYTSASIHTNGRFDFTYGKILVRAKVAEGRGVWPAIWMLSSEYRTVRWPLSGEIDMMEYVGFKENKFHVSVHTQKNNWRRGNSLTKAFDVADPTKNFHEYGVIWNSEEITFLLNGKPIHTYPNDGGGKESWPFDGPMFLIMNLAIGGVWGGQKGIDPDIFPAEFQVDYVRVYSLK
jgi:beta-glucanase (GH16 family)